MNAEFLLAWYSVKDLAEAKGFYAETLGLQKIFEMEGWAEFSHAPSGPAIGLSAMPEAQGAGGATVVFRVADIYRAREEMSARGVKFEGEVNEIPGVVRIATFYDPSGNRLQLAQDLTQTGGQT
jgi:predicted enzyme related to lactoylglutathione lyase